MSIKNNTIIKKENQSHHLTLEDRAKIQALLEQKEESGKRSTIGASFLLVLRAS